MTELSEKILAEYQVRKKRKHKTQFIEFMKENIPDILIEEGGFARNRNLIVGDVSKADIILGAHYDTCAALPFPNFIMPKNFLITFLYSCLICIPFFMVSLLVSLLLSFVTDDFFVISYGAFLACLGLMFFVFMGGKPNKHTANDNTSGVITLCELMATLSEEEKRRIAFVFFDNEENGLLGSSYFRRVHKKELKNKLLINFDCVSDGDNVMVVLNGKARKRHGQNVREAFYDGEGKKVYIERSSMAMYPSDQMGFSQSVAVAVLKKKRFIGLYMNRIHTSRDTVFQRENIQFICECTKRFIGSVINSES